MPNYLDVTEIAGEDVSHEQVQRVATRYAWACRMCAGKDVLEVACGSGPGLGVIARVARSLVAGDISDDILARARRHYGDRIDIRRMDAQSLPFKDGTIDVIIIFEALYYIQDPSAFISECRRVLRDGGLVLVSNANKDLSDFNPSPYSHVYHGVVELNALFRQAGFETAFWGDVRISQLSWRQRILRPIKRTVVSLGLMPKSMAGKKLLKRIVFGSMEPFPVELTAEAIATAGSPTPIADNQPDRQYKVVLCAATKTG